MTLFIYCCAGLITLIALTCLATIISWYKNNHSLLRGRLPYRLRFVPAHSLAERRTVAFLTDSLSPAIKRLYSGFEQTILAKNRPLYNIDLFEGEGKTRLTRQHLLHFLSNDYDCIVTTSLLTTQLAQEVTASQRVELPIIFGNIPDSEYHIIQHPTAYRHTTGVLTERDVAAEFAHIKMLRGGISTALLLYPAVSLRWLEYQQEQLLGSLESHAIRVQTLEVTHEKIAALDPTPFDMVIVPSHTLSNEQISILAARCARGRCTLYTTAIDAVAHGAALGTGGGEAEIGSLVGEKVHEVMAYMTSPYLIPITTHIPAAQVRLHKKQLADQHVFISDDLVSITDASTVRWG